MRIEIVDYMPYRVIAAGEIDEKDIPSGLTVCPDNVIRISSLVWNEMTLEEAEKLLKTFNAGLI